MATDLTVILENRPGTLADLGGTLGKAGINIEGLCGFPSEGDGVFHVLVEDAAAARSALEEAGIEVRSERQVVVLECEDRPGELGKICRRIADAGVNIDLFYLATDTRLVIGADDLVNTGIIGRRVFRQGFRGNAARHALGNGNSQRRRIGDADHVNVDGAFRFGG